MPVAVQGGSVDFDELDGSPKVRATSRTRAATRVGRFAWSAIDALIAECVPPLGQRPARYPGVPQLIVVDLDIQPDETTAISDCGGDVKIYAYGIATIQYATPSYDPDTGNLIEWRRDYGGSMLTLPGEGFVWASDDAKIEIDDVRPAKVVPEITLSLTQHRLASADVPRAAILAAFSKVNDATWNGYGAETVLYLGAQEQQTLNAAGDLETQATHKLIVRSFVDDGVSVTHNHLWRPDTKKFEKLKRGGSSPAKYIYETTSAIDDVFYAFS